MMSRPNSEEVVEFWQMYRGVEWHVRVVPRSRQGGVDIYIGGQRNLGGRDPENYPHIHAYYPDLSRKPLKDLATISWNHERRNYSHTQLAKLVDPANDLWLGGIQQYVIGLLADLGEEAYESPREYEENLAKAEKLLLEVKGSTRYQRNHWESAVELSNELKRLKDKYRHSNDYYHRNRQLLDKTFERLKTLKEEARKFQEDSAKIRRELQSAISKVIQEIRRSQPEEIRKQHERLVDLQKNLKSVNLNREDRSELYKLLDSAFLELKRLRDKLEQKQKENYNNLIGRAYKAKELASRAEQNLMREASEQLKQISNEIREAQLSKERREELKRIVDQGFQEIKRRRDKRLGEQITNEKWMHKQVTDCELEASTTQEFRTSFERLKSVSAELRSVDLRREDRESLKTRMDNAFAKLKSRQDQDRKFRNKERRDRLYDLLASKRQAIDRLQSSIYADQSYLSELYDRRSRIRSGPRAAEIAYSIEQKIDSVHRKISDKNAKILEIHASIRELESKIRDLM